MTEEESLEQLKEGLKYMSDQADTAKDTIQKQMFLIHSGSIVALMALIGELISAESSLIAISLLPMSCFISGLYANIMALHHHLEIAGLGKELDPKKSPTRESIDGLLEKSKGYAAKRNQSIKVSHYSFIVGAVASILLVLLYSYQLI